MSVSGVNLLEHLQTPALIVTNGQVSFANNAAKVTQSASRLQDCLK